MKIPALVIMLLLAYLLGSIPTAVWIGRIFYKTDVRLHGSGNAGATNVIRVFGWSAGIPVLLIDLAKGWAATSLPVFMHMAPASGALIINLQILAGLTAITGHIFPILAGFRGGKGVATIFGMLLALQPVLTLCVIGVFLAVLLITGIVSVSSMSAGTAFPALLFLFFDSPSVIFKVFSILVTIALIITHRKNIRRLMKGEESRLFSLRTKKTIRR